jgi:glycosyltransferase involved in cell wall biosynthesis
MISIITPVYNGVRFIETCLQVVIDQHCPEVEHIIVDGGSIDGTVDIIRRYADQYPHIRWLSETDRGQSDAMNKGLGLARGEVVGFLNVDDFYEPNVLNCVVEIFRTLPEPSLLVGDCNVWDDKGQLLYVNQPKRLKFTDLLLGSDANPYPINPSAYFYHASVHQIIGPYKVNEHYALDLDFLLRAVQAATPKYMHQTWGNWCMVAGSKTVEDARTLEGQLRAVYLLKAYRQKLPRWQRWRIAVVFAFYKQVWGPLKYFPKHPDELSWRLKARLKRILGLAPQRKV